MAFRRHDRVDDETTMYVGEMLNTELNTLHVI